MEVLPEIRKAYSFCGISSLETNENEYLHRHNKKQNLNFGQENNLNKLKNSEYKLCYIGFWILLLYVIKTRLSPFHMKR